MHEVDWLSRCLLFFPRVALAVSQKTVSGLSLASGERLGHPARAGHLKSGGMRETAVAPHRHRDAGKSPQVVTNTLLTLFPTLTDRLAWVPPRPGGATSFPPAFFLLGLGIRGCGWKARKAASCQKFTCKEHRRWKAGYSVIRPGNSSA
jgi:hypothetical protein